MDIQHEPEFGNPSRPLSEKEKQEARETAAAYSRLFSSEDGQRVLADLLKKFDPVAPRFFRHTCIVTAAVIDGRSDVVRDILSAIRAGTPFTGISPKTPHP